MVKLCFGGQVRPHRVSQESYSAIWSDRSLGLHGMMQKGNKDSTKVQLIRIPPFFALFATEMPQTWPAITARVFYPWRNQKPTRDEDDDCFHFYSMGGNCFCNGNEVPDSSTCKKNILGSRYFVYDEKYGFQEKVSKPFSCHSLLRMCSENVCLAVILQITKRFVTPARPAITGISPATIRSTPPPSGTVVPSA